MTDNAWENFAKQNPYWAVLTDPRYKTGNTPLPAELQAQFFRSGEEHIQRVMNVLHRHFDRRFSAQDTCLDFGSGVGRLLLPMARHCGRAIGIDVSETMRRLCMQHALDLRIGNVACHDTIDHPALAETGFDWVNSYIVFQHIETSKGYASLRTILGKVRRGGVISIHLTVFKDTKLLNYITDKSKYFCVNESGISKIETQEPYYNEDAMMMNDYDMTKINIILTEYGFKKIFAEHENQDGMHGYILYSIKE